MILQDRVQALQDKLQRARATMFVYKAELKRQYAKLKKHKLNPSELSDQIKEITAEINSLENREMDLLKKAEATLLKIERKLDE